MLNLQLIGENWKISRESQPEKLVNYKWIESFESTLSNVDSPEDLTVRYYTQSSEFSKRSIAYTEGTPVVQFFKMSPGVFFIENFDNTLWKNQDIDSNIRDKFSSVTKYIQPDKTYQFDKPYILFALQSINFTDTTLSKRLLIELIYWAETNKRYVLFKLHPFTKPDDKIVKYWQMIQSAGIIKEYAVLVDASYDTTDLIKRADEVWTYSSGVSLEAVLHNKPTMCFAPNTEFAAIVNVSSSPLALSYANAVTEEDVNRFLSWYYHKLIIDVSREDLQAQIEKRINDCVTYDFDPIKVFA